ncbi:MAG: response regulator, partial [Spirochaetales bacterium]
VLPFEPAVSPALDTAPAPPVTAEIKTALHARVLLVEDNPINAKVAERVLSSYGHKVIWVSEGSRAAAAAAADDFDIILMDIEMPGMNGFETTVKIRTDQGLKKSSRVPVIAMTAHVLHEIREKCFAAGMDDYITKPVNFYELNTLITRYLKKKANYLSLLEKHPAAFAGSNEILNKKIALKRMGNDSALLSELYKIFYDDIPKRKEQFQKAVAAGDFSQIGQSAHSLKGTAGTMGAERLSSAAVELEAAARGMNSGLCKNLLSKLEKELDSVRSLLHTIQAAEKEGSSQP